MPAPGALPYRPCVGIALFNASGRVWIGQRADAPDEAEGAGTWWQMPQGGVDAGEDPYEAALRELYEETSATSVSLIARAPQTIRYDLPSHLVPQSWGGRYRGQEQHWFALRFDGGDEEINVAAPGG
ncbi:MAG: RNA pyrophosphohydrolase, partial [Alphaproteobacteria bacterium]